MLGLHHVRRREGGPRGHHQRDQARDQLQRRDRCHLRRRGRIATLRDRFLTAAGLFVSLPGAAVYPETAISEVYCDISRWLAPLCPIPVPLLSFTCLDLHSAANEPHQLSARTKTLHE